MKKITMLMLAIVLASHALFTTQASAKPSEALPDSNDSRVLTNNINTILRAKANALGLNIPKEGDTCTGDEPSVRATVNACNVEATNCPGNIATCDNCSGTYMCITADGDSTPRWVFAATGTVSNCACGLESASGAASTAVRME